ncbi:dual-specificity phosphatase [Emydomyces testavorans]|uniref:protein-tyrosine-phosphatase n=1 Tax=Emydomyces testavorans TaxID=2070801 RepID=A0AAF0DJF2_9EURO|nr:dual-specificity phosphatase [Emydomyces testavorans]
MDAAERKRRYNMLEDNHINAIVSLVNARCGWWCNFANHGIPKDRHKWVQCVDTDTQDLLVYMSDICDFIDRMADPALSSLSSLPATNAPALLSLEDLPIETEDKPCSNPPNAILVHCELGISRSPTVIIAYLMRKLRLPRASVLEFLQTRQRVKPSANFTRQLDIWDEVGYQIWEDEERTKPKVPYKLFLADRAARFKAKGLTGNEPLAPLTLEPLSK